MEMRKESTSIKQEGEEIRIDREYVMKPRSIVVFTGREVLR